MCFRDIDENFTERRNVSLVHRDQSWNNPIIINQSPPPSLSLSLSPLFLSWQMASFAQCPQFRFHCAFNQQLMHSSFPIWYYSQICLACEKTTKQHCVFVYGACMCVLHCCVIWKNGSLVILNPSSSDCLHVTCYLPRQRLIRWSWPGWSLIS